MMDYSENRNPSDISFWALLREDLACNNGEYRMGGFRTLAVHRFGNWRMGIRNRALRAPFSLLYRTLYRRYKRQWGIDIPWSVRVGRRVTIEHQSGLVVNGDTQIGNDVMLRHNTTLGIRKPTDTRAPVICDNVDIGTGAVVLGGITIGANSVIAANAVVLQDVPPGALVAGVPAKVVTSVTEPDGDRARLRGL